MQISVVIPTYGRANDLDRCLNSIIIQSLLPKEIIIVDDSEDNQIKDLIEFRKNEFKSLKYIRNIKEKSNTIARNIGVKNASSDIILFLDSDVILDKNYIKEISKVYEDKSNAFGVQGLITNLKKTGFFNKLVHLYNRLFLIRAYTQNKFLLLPSMGVSVPFTANGIIICEWLSGANMSYRKKIFKEFQFDENLKKYSWGDDCDFGYRIFKKYPSSLYLTPKAKLIHNSSNSGRHDRKETIYMSVVYSIYLFYKNINQTLKNKFLYIWSMFGRLIFKYLYVIKRPLDAIYMTKAIFYSIVHLGELKTGDLDFFNEKIGAKISKAYPFCHT